MGITEDRNRLHYQRRIIPRRLKDAERRIQLLEDRVAHLESSLIKLAERRAEKARNE